MEIDRMPTIPTAPLHRLGLAAVLATALLTACQTNPSAPEALASKLNAPVPVLAADAKGLAIIGYYSGPDSEAPLLHKTAQPGGFYRVYMGKNNAGQHLLQEFYQDSGSAQSSAYPVDPAADLLEWEITPQDGEVTFYRPNGEVRSTVVYRNGKLNGRTVYYNDDGSERTVYNWVDDQMSGPFLVREPSTGNTAKGTIDNDQLVQIEGQDAQGKPLTQEQALQLLTASFSEWHDDLFK